MRTLGIIDIGSNSIKLLVVKINNDKTYEGVYNKKFQTRLTDYMSEDKDELSVVGIKNFFGIISTFKVICTQFNCDEVIAVGTESLRKLKNTNQLITDIEASLNINIKVLSPDEECYYGYLSSIPSNLDNYLHLDVGGGSVEIALIKDKVLVKCISIPMGALSITYQFNLTDKTTNKEKDVRSYIIQQLDNVSWLSKCKNLPIIVIGGSVKTIGRIHKMEYNTDKNIHGYELYNKSIENLLNEINKMTVEEILSSTGVSKTRGDILLGALLIINTILNYLESSSLYISKYTIRDGILAEYINNLK
ncbi:MAG: hypothetical protein RSG52_09590 [Terrisporobacter sp.]|uniref:Ppx/GppA phosphatase family protein n=1 Tax=Terrisporobacter sp. TaxID=1965305 RepID=UPI002FCB38E5